MGIFFQMRLRNAFGRALDSGYIPLTAYAASPNFTGLQSPNTAQLITSDPWQATPWYPEMYFPANSALFADLQALNTGDSYYSFHIYLQGVKRFQNENCKDGKIQPAKTSKTAMPPATSPSQPHYVPNFAMYSRPPDGWHDEPFEYVFTFQQTFAAPITSVAQASLANVPMQLDPDADFYMRGLAILQDYLGGGPT